MSSSDTGISETLKIYLSNPEMLYISSCSLGDFVIKRHISSTRPNDRKYCLLPLTFAKFLSTAVSWEKKTRKRITVIKTKFFENERNIPKLQNWTTYFNALKYNYIISLKSSYNGIQLKHCHSINLLVYVTYSWSLFKTMPSCHNSAMIIIIVTTHMGSYKIS